MPPDRSLSNRELAGTALQNAYPLTHGFHAGPAAIARLFGMHAIIFIDVVAIKTFIHFEVLI